MEINIQKLYNKSKIPIKGDPNAAAWDIYAHSISQQEGAVEVGTGVAIETPPGYMGVVAPRSNISKYGWMLSNSIGIIDPTYSNEWICKYRQVGRTVHAFPYKVGERVAQIFFLPIVDFSFNEVDEITDVGRGVGFGSTGLS